VSCPTRAQGYPLSTEASWVNYHMADAVAAPAELWSALYSEAALLMPCSYHLNGHPVHQGQPPPRINSLMVEGGLDGKGYRYREPRNTNPREPCIHMH
jgi:hypothetical protein